MKEVTSDQIEHSITKATLVGFTHESDPLSLECLQLEAVLYLGFLPR